jgi:predicted choloylglycine hydrolase
MSLEVNPVPEDWREPHGVHFAIAIRAALDQCHNIDEALDLWQSMPIGSNCTFLVSDPSGNAAQIEIAGKKRALKRIGSNTNEQCLVSANHFTLISWPGSEAYVPSDHSTRRHGLSFLSPG